MLSPKIVVGKSKISGKGLIAKEFIKKDELVWELDRTERKLTKKELLKLPKNVQDLAYQQNDKFIVVTDGSEYINHSCDPNVWWEGDEKFVARKDIHPGEEVTYDYATSDIDPEGLPGFKCNCGVKNCREFVRWDNILGKRLQNIYKNHLPSWVLQFIENYKD
ncbi:MAG: SET domain-containing protein-lysine N-methyltransferase [Candidatus Dojkabacteria bacterium]|nr:SET domain-containing protein-lysine N-methyltransferase [Candidatus Dojkabacteria bacterium]